MGQRNYHWQAEEIVVATYKAGTVTMDVVDTAENRMIWQSVAKGALDKNESKKRKRISKAAQRLFKKYPVKAAK